MNGQLQSGMTLRGLSSGTYKLNVTDRNGCETVRNIEISQPSRGNISIDGPSIEVKEGEDITLTLITTGIDSIASIAWFGPEGTCDNCMEWVVWPIKGENHYIVTVIDKNGCIYEAEFAIIAVRNYFIPSVFSPNGDGNNDFFNIFSDSSIEEIEVLEVYSRWGELVYRGEHIKPGSSQEGWDGTFKGQPLAPGVFIYRANIRSRVGLLFEEAGDVTLIR